MKKSDTVMRQGQKHGLRSRGGILLLITNISLLIYSILAYEAVGFLMTDQTRAALMFACLFWASIGFIFTILHRTVIGKIGRTILNIIVLYLCAAVVSNSLSFDLTTGLLPVGAIFVASCVASIPVFLIMLLILRMVKLNNKTLILICGIFVAILVSACALKYNETYRTAIKCIDLKELSGPKFGWTTDYLFIGKAEREKLHKMFSAYILKKYFEPADIKQEQHYESHVIYGVKKVRELMLIYGYMWFGSYGSKEGRNDDDSGGHNPIILIAKKQGGEYIVFDDIEPMNGTYYYKSLSVMFPNRYRAMLDCPGYNQVPTITQQREKYLKSVGL